MTRHVSCSGYVRDETEFFPEGWSRTFHDICDWSADHFCWMWTGSLPLYLYSLVRLLTLGSSKTYTDLRQLRVDSVVQAMLSD